MVSTEDPPKDTDALRDNDPAHAELIDTAYTNVKEGIASHKSLPEILKLRDRYGSLARLRILKAGESCLTLYGPE